MQANKITKDVSYDVGVPTHYYSSNHLQPGMNTAAIRGQTGDGPACAKYSGKSTDDVLGGALAVIGNRYRDAASMNYSVHVTPSGKNTGKTGVAVSISTIT